MPKTMQQEDVEHLFTIFLRRFIMKEFVNKHPFITFFIVDTVVCGVVNIVQILRTGKPFYRIQIDSKAENKED